MTVIELGTQKLRPQKNHTVCACGATCVTESVQERQYVHLGLYCPSEHLTSKEIWKNFDLVLKIVMSAQP
jgi:hypothetical protein